jgi:hypothetical protein
MKTAGLMNSFPCLVIRGICVREELTVGHTGSRDG